MKKLLKHRSGVIVELDSSKIVPNDPGQDTPALVLYKDGTSTLTCAENEGYVFHDRKGDIELPEAAKEWLWSNEVQDEVEKMYDAGKDGTW